MVAMSRFKKKKWLPIKLLVVVVLLVGIIQWGFPFINDKDMSNKGGHPSEMDHSAESDGEGHSTNEDGQEVATNEDSDILLNNIISLSKLGKIEVTSFVAGETQRKKVLAAWGEPSNIQEVHQVRYEDYPSRQTTIGYKGEVIMELRSNESHLSGIHYQDIIRKFGEADQVNYYKDESHDQIILVYNVNSEYQLKWILPKPSSEAPNPVVDHTAVLRITPVPNLISTMRLEEKIGQMVMAGLDGTSLQQNEEKFIMDDHIGGFIFYSNNLKSPDQARQLVDNMKEKNRANGIPLFISVDQEGGRIARLPGVTTTPSNEVIGKKNDAKYAYQIGRTLGKNLKSLGFNLDFAPVLDINSNPQNPVIGDRSFGNQASLVSKLGVQTMKGIQSENIISVIKHFPGHGDTAVDSHVQLPVVTKSLDELNKLELIPFQNAIRNGADVVMVAHILLPKLDSKYPASMSKEVITDLLRKNLQFNGVVITDDMTMGAVVRHFDIGESAVDSILAGSDIILVAHDYTNVVKVIHSIKQAVKNGQITEERINQSVNRILHLKDTYLEK